MKKVDSKELYDFVLKSGGSVSEAKTSVMINIYGLTFYKCFVLAEQNFGINLMPCDCISVLEKIYGKKLEKMNPKTIYNKVYLMMKIVDGNPCEENIKDSVNYYLEN